MVKSSVHPTPKERRELAVLLAQVGQVPVKLFDGGHPQRKYRKLVMGQSSSLTLTKEDYLLMPKVGAYQREVNPVYLLRHHSMSV